MHFIFSIQVCKHKTLAASSKNTSFDSSSHYEDINVTSKEYAIDGHESGDGDFSHSDGGGVHRRMRYPKVLPDFPATVQYTCSGTGRRLSLPPPMMMSVGGLEQPGTATKIPPPPPPRISSTLGRKKDPAKTSVADGGTPISVAVHQFDRHQPARPDAIPEEHKSPVVPCVPNKVCPAVTTALSARKPAEPRIVIKASTSTVQPSHRDQLQLQKNSKRTNIPRVVHPQNADNVEPVLRSSEGDTGTIKRKKK